MIPGNPVATPVTPGSGLCISRFAYDLSKIRGSPKGWAAGRLAKGTP